MEAGESAEAAAWSEIKENPARNKMVRTKVLSPAMCDRHVLIG